MWVRSQDKEILLNASYFDISDGDIIGIYANNDGNEVTIATYSTKEKAIKVMSLLETHINRMYSTQCNEWNPNVGYYDYTVFQFPKDNEVEV